MGGELWGADYMEILAEECESPVLNCILTPAAPGDVDSGSGNR